MNFVIKKIESKGSRQAYGVASGIIGIFLNFLLFVLKLVVGFVLGSVAVMADAFNNLADSASSLVTIVGFRMSAKPADKEHPFGHGRIEDVAGLIIAMSMIFIGIEFARSSIMSIIAPEPLNFSWVSVGLLVLGFFVKLWMFAFNRRLGRKIGSNVLHAVATDSRNDCIIAAFTLMAIFAAHLFGINADGPAGLVVSLILIHGGYKSARDSASAIIGKPAEKAIAQAIKEIVLGHEGVLGAHDLVVHNYGPGKNVATIHMEVDMHTPLNLCHDMADAVEAAVLAQLGISLTVHLDPIDTNCKLSDIVKIYLGENYPCANAHEFKKSDNFFKFELQLPHGFDKNLQNTLLAEIRQKIAEQEAETTVEIDIEFGFVEEDWF
ncbi:MAG: cation diffusion facilitator family transporter [Clostridiales bacterium]|jgi:cation diffusion facilitator family transporter|nr:cation diffusion facilitator family transporter [Clostridiales bacterium]